MSRSIRPQWARPFARPWGYYGAGTPRDGSAAPSVYFPGTLPGYASGIDADYAYTDSGNTTLASVAGDRIYSFLDMSGNGRHCQQSVQATRPKWSRIAGHGAASFDFTQFATTSSFLGSAFDTACTVYMVCEPALVSDNLQLMLCFGSGGTTLFFGRGNSGGTRDVGDHFTGNLSTSGNRLTTWTGGNRFVMTLRYNGTTRRRGIYTPDGGVFETDEATTGNLGATGGICLGNQSSGGGFGYCGMITDCHSYSNAHVEASYDAMVADLLARKCSDPSAGTLSSGAGQKLVAFSGNSLVAGDQGGGTTIPGLLQTNLGGSWTVSNLGLSGYSTGRLNELDQERVDLLFSSSAAKAVCCVWEVTNDLYYTSGLESAKKRIRDYCLRRKAQGWYVIVGNVLPRQDVNTPGGFEAARGSFNTWLAANYTSFAHALVDCAGVSGFTDPAGGGNFAADKVHLTAAGYTAQEPGWRTAILAA